MQTKYPGTPHWSFLADELCDGDGCSPDAEQFVRAMQEFRADACISDYYFVDCSEDGINPGHEPELYHDPWHNDEPRPSWECGPEPSEIDFSELPEGRVDLDAATELLATCQAKHPPKA